MDQLEEYRNIGVALVDKQGARFFCFHLGELVDQEGILGKRYQARENWISNFHPRAPRGID